MKAYYLVIAGLLFSTVVGQALPELPDFPSPSPPASPSPLPSVLNDLVNPSPSPLAPTAIPPGLLPTQSPTGPTAAVSPTLIPSGPQASSSPVPEPTASQPASPSPLSEFFDEDGVCVRDETKPRPILGKSQLRYAVSVLLSAAAVALASVFYGAASDWEPEIDHFVYRVIFIVMARLLIIGAVKVSAALVASITKASPDDGALDASGAFLTWGTAIFTRLYYEGIKMTMAVLEFTKNECVWDDKLKDFFSIQGSEEHVISKEGGDREDQEFLTTDESSDSKRSRNRVSLIRKIAGGNFERRLFLITTVLYFASEISVLTANVLDLVGAFAETPDRISFFSSDDQGGQCGITSRDVPLIAGVIAVQSIYTLTQQPSLVPLLTVSAFCPVCERYPAFNKVLRQLKWLACLILILWVTSLLTLPLFSKPLQPFFTSGDISLFWYVIIAPPSFSFVSYIITATYTCFAAVAGIVIILGIARSQRTEEDGLEELP